MTETQAIQLLKLETSLKCYAETQADDHLNSVLDILKKLNLSLLADFCHTNQNVQTLLALPVFEPFWTTKREAIRVKSRPMFCMQKTSRLSEQNIVLGYKYYLMSLAAADENQKKEYLLRSLSYHSFHAFNKLAHEFFMKDMPVSEEQFLKLANLLPSLEEEAKWYGTPGYLRVANLYFKIALYLLKLNNDSENPQTQNQISAAFQCALKNLERARQLESKSAAEINNAYFGDGLAKSNPFNFDSIKEMRAACIKAAGSFLDQISINSTKMVSIPVAKEETVSYPPCSEVQLAILEDAPEKIKDYPEALEPSTLWFAVRHGKINSVRYLLEWGVTPEVDDNKNTLLHIAAVNSNMDIFDLIFEKAPHLCDQQNLQGLRVNNILEYQSDSVVNYDHLYGGAFFTRTVAAQKRKIANRDEVFPLTEAHSEGYLRI